MGIKLSRLFVTAVYFGVILGVSSFHKMAFSEEDSFTAASGFNRNFSSDDGEEKRGENVSGNALFGGNVGIGTNEPQAKLHIGGKPGVDGIMFPDGTMQTTATTSSGESNWGTVGVSDNIIEASWQALVDSVEYKLFKDKKKNS
jgi:hypothetical protein